MLHTSDQHECRNLPEDHVVSSMGAAVSTAPDGHIELYTLNDNGTWHVDSYNDAGRAWAALDEFDEAV